MSIILSNLKQLKKFHWEIPGKFAVKRTLRILPHLQLCCYTTLRNIKVSKKAVNDKVQGSVVGLLVTDLLLSRSVSENFLISEYLAKLQERK